MSQSPTSAGAMGLGNMLNNQGGIPSMAAEQHPNQAQIHPQYVMDRPNSPHGSEHSRYSGPMSTSYPSPTAMGAQLPPVPTANMGPTPHQLASLSQSQPHAMPPAGMSPMGMSPVGIAPTGFKPNDGTQQAAPSKNFACSTCHKAFARRSDLARHERIHSGIRPHVCDYPGCNKQFIQRSALTVHQRVHTGEKPHVCERCGKPFSDSSSLARHRRIHSGKRPYKCPYADCQKTFTRRTTLTRHQNLHTGTIEEAALNTARALAAAATRGASVAAGSQTRPEGEQTSNHGSPLSTPSPAQRTMSMSPGDELAGMNNMGYIANNSLPPHLRSDAHVGSPSSTTSSGYNTGMRPTSHPIGYAPPPQTLEPSIEHQQGPGSVTGSPHIASVGWASPGPVGSPAQSPGGSNSYVYPDPEGYPGGGNIQMFYPPQAAQRRPGSTEPGANSYEAKNTRPSELWAAAP